MNQVYRFEIEGKGVHSADERSPKVQIAIENWMEEYWRDTTLRPDARRDFPNVEWYGKFFGCVSIESLKEWFTLNRANAFDALITCKKVELVVYKVPEVIEGESKRQVIFDPEKAEREVLDKNPHRGRL